MSEKTRITNNSNVWDAQTGRPVSKSRRSFLANAGMYGAGLAGSALLGACSDSDSVAQTPDGGCDPNAVVIGGPSDQAILNFALNLEYLEAEYYLRAVTGSGLPSNLTGGAGRTDSAGVTGGRKVNFTTPLIGNYAAEIAQDEQAHVADLRTALNLGGNNFAAAEPDINLDAVMASFGFDPFKNELNFLLGAFIFEDVGVTAYHGGAPFIKNRAYLDAAAGILAVEAYHAGLIRTVLTAGAADNPDDVDIEAIVKTISDARDGVDGDTTAQPPGNVPALYADADQGIATRQITLNGSAYTASNIVPVTNSMDNPNAPFKGVAFNRTVAQIHNIAYVTAERVSKGGFFPMGTNIPSNPELQFSADNTAMSSTTTG